MHRIFGLTLFSWSDFGPESKGLDTKKTSELFDSLRFVLFGLISVRGYKWRWRDLFLMLQMRLYQQLAKSEFCCATNLQPNFTNPVPPLAARLLLVHL